MEYWRASFSRLSVRGGSSASVYRLSVGEVLYYPRASLSPWWCIVFSTFKYVFLAAPYIKLLGICSSAMFNSVFVKYKMSSSLFFLASGVS